MKIYFVIVGWNNIDLLDECLNSIYLQARYECGVIYVDNGSKDDSLEHIRREFPQVITIDAESNLGFAIANNLGIERALQDPSCQYVGFLNTDATISKNWVETIVSFAKKHPNAASFQTPTLDYYDHKILDSRGIKIDVAGRAIQLGYREAATQTYVSHQVFGVNAAACIYTGDFLRRQPFGKEYFDADLWMYLEDVDLAARAVALGYENWLVSGSQAYHMGSASSSKNPGFSVFHIYRNNLLVLLKNIPAGALIAILPRVLLSDFVLILKLLRYRNITTIKVIIKARLKSIRMLKVFLKKRKKLLAIAPPGYQKRLHPLLQAK